MRLEESIKHIRLTKNTSHFLSKSHSIHPHCVSLQKQEKTPQILGVAQPDGLPFNVTNVQHFLPQANSILPIRKNIPHQAEICPTATATYTGAGVGRSERRIYIAALGTSQESTYFSQKSLTSSVKKILISRETYYPFWMLRTRIGWLWKNTLNTWCSSMWPISQFI